ncbi:Ig-like domain-containing protein [Porphyromonas levii]|uniref:Ig-like domain-containing protein n=1 Tax=Porphyromonas levii TaxID=28114 RepID=UPI001B8A94AC|nr:Ig-like domain-containing protein [Porphyromonas levii]MBR8769903.1 hypothetical protein [Porphyromonas levii]
MKKYFSLIIAFFIFVFSSVSCSNKSGEIQELRATKLTFKETNISLKVGDKIKLEVVEYPEKGTYDLIEWQSSNYSVVRIDEKGYIEAISRGESTVTLVTNLGTIECNVRVEYIPLASFSLVNDNVIIKEDETFQLEVVIEPKEILQYSPTVTFRSNKPEVVEVDENGLLKANQEGTAVVTATFQDHVYDPNLRSIVLQEASDECPVVVKRKPKVKFKKSSTELEIGTSTMLEIVYDGELNGIGFDFFSSNEAVVSVDKTGIVTAHKEGSAEVIVRAKDNSTEDKILVSGKAFYSFFNVVSVIDSWIITGEWMTKQARTIVSYRAKKKIYISHIELLSDESYSGSALLIQYYPITLLMPDKGNSFEFYLKYEQLHEPFLRMHIYDKDTRYILRKSEHGSKFYLEKQEPSDIMSHLFD